MLDALEIFHICYIIYTLHGPNIFMFNMFEKCYTEYMFDLFY